MKMPDTTPLRPLAFQRENRDIHLALMRGSQAYLAERGDHRFADRGMFAKVLLLILTGGLNYHLTHHLFPGWNHRHYPALAAILAELAPRYAMDYRCIGYRELLQQQQRFLRSMGQQPL